MYCNLVETETNTQTPGEHDAETERRLGGGSGKFAYMKSQCTSVGIIKTSKPTVFSGRLVSAQEAPGCAGSQDKDPPVGCHKLHQDIIKLKQQRSKQKLVSWFASILPIVSLQKSTQGTKPS